MRNPLLAIIFKARGVKCDAEGCDYREEQTDLSNRTIARIVNKPCPKCGANLLTEADAATLCVMRRGILYINIIAFPFMVLLLPVTLLCILCKKKVPKIPVSMNGTGVAKIEWRETPPPTP